MVEEEAPRRPRWWLRWLRRLGFGFLAVVLLLTAFCLLYNAKTAGRASPPGGLRFVATDDTQTRYRQWGTTGPPVVLVHGAAESADTWARMAPVLAATHRVYALDLVGWGYTRRVGRPDLDHQGRQLLPFLHALRLDRPVLAAHSSGAAIAAEATLRAPARVGGLLFLDGKLVNAAMNMATDGTLTSSDLLGMSGVVITPVPVGGYGEGRLPG